MQTWLVGLDVGTTSCKAVVMTPEGREVASGRAPTPWTTTALGTQTGGEELVVAARAALSSAVAAAPGPAASWVSGSPAWPSRGSC